MDSGLAVLPPEQGLLLRHFAFSAKLTNIKIKNKRKQANILGQPEAEQGKGDAQQNKLGGFEFSFLEPT